MPSPNKSQLNLSVDSDLKERFKALCDLHPISLAKAFESFMFQCLEAEEIVSIPSPSISPSINIDDKIETAIQEAISPIQEELLRLVEIVETLQQSLENTILEPDGVMEDELVGEGVTSASLSAIFEEPDAISEIEDIEPIQEATITEISLSSQADEKASILSVNSFDNDLANEEAKTKNIPTSMSIEAELSDPITTTIELDTKEGISTDEFHDILINQGVERSKRWLQMVAKEDNIPLEWGYRAAKIDNKWRWFPL